MLDIETIKSYYPPILKEKKEFERHFLKEYVELMALDFLSRSKYAPHITFIGGTNLRLVKGIPRFSEDLDFDCKKMDKQLYLSMTDDLMSYFKSFGLTIEDKFRENPTFNTYQCKIIFKGLVYDMGLSPHQTENLFLKIDTQDQGVDYPRRMARIERCGYSFSIPVPEDKTLLSMKLLSILQRGKGRDYFDTLYLKQMTDPDWDFLYKKAGIGDEKDLKQRMEARLQEVDLHEMAKEFRHLIFPNASTDNVLRFAEIMGYQVTPSTSQSQKQPAPKKKPQKKPTTSTGPKLK